MIESKEPWQRNAAERATMRDRASGELGARATSDYTPPVGPGSKSLSPTGDWRDLPPGLIPETRRKT